MSICSSIRQHQDVALSCLSRCRLSKSELRTKRNRLARASDLKPIYFCRQTSKEVTEHVAQLIVDAIKEHEAASQRPFVLGLPTGSSPLGVYEALVRMHTSGLISFKVSFRLPWRLSGETDP